MKILSLCGGGTSGYMTTCILDKIEKELQIKIKDEFDFIAGVSTGSIIGAMLDDYYVEDIQRKYIDFQSLVFGKKANFLMSIFKPLYDIEKLHTSAIHTFNSKHINDIASYKFLTYALELNNGVLGPKFWKSWEDSSLISSIVTASSCVPGAFKPFDIDGKLYFDGGVIRNNPTLPIVADVIKLGTPLSDIKCLTIATDYHRGFGDDKKLKGLFNVSKSFSMLAIDGGERVSSYIADKILGNNIVEVIPDVYLPVESNDWETMRRIADITWKLNKDRIIKLLS